MSVSAAITVIAERTGHLILKCALYIKYYYHILLTKLLTSYNHWICTAQLLNASAAFFHFSL